MDFFDVVNNRRSIRIFKKNQEIPDKILNQIIETAVKAPSAGNLQTWEFIIVNKQQLKDDLAKAAFGQRFIAQAPVVIVVCANKDRSAIRYRRRGSDLFCLQDTAAAIQTMLLTITALGYGACWVGAFREDAVIYILKIPERMGIRPVAIIPLGVPEKIPNPTSRRAVKELIHYNTY